MSSSSIWDPARYEGNHSYVWEFGAALLDLLAPQPGERILDVGCGTGQLTAEIAARGALVLGIDNSIDMLGQARQNYPALKFALADAASFRLPEKFDAVFSNAALHWVKNSEAAVQAISEALRPGGRFVAEFGGHGNIRLVLRALREVFGEAAEQRCPWTFPSIGEYSSLLEKHSLEVRQAWLFDRPTPVEGESGMRDWLEMFAGSYFTGKDASEQRSKIAEQLRPQMFHDGIWKLDYRRLRILAIRC